MAKWWKTAVVETLFVSILCLYELHEEDLLKELELLVCSTTH